MKASESSSVGFWSLIWCGDVVLDLEPVQDIFAGFLLADGNVDEPTGGMLDPGSDSIGRGGDRQFFHEEGNGREGLVLHVRKKPPVVPPEQRRVQNAQEVKVADGYEKRLVVCRYGRCDPGA